MRKISAKKREKIIKKIEYFKDDIYECILPVIKTDIYFSDIICSNNGIYYYYHDIKGNDHLLDNFANSIENYNVDRYIDSEEIKKEYEEKNFVTYDGSSFTGNNFYIFKSIYNS